MKSRKEIQKPVIANYGSDELKKAKKLKPVKKEKNQKQSLILEIDEFEDIDMDYKTNEFDEDFDDDDIDDDDYDDEDYDDEEDEKVDKDY